MFNAELWNCLIVDYKFDEGKRKKLALPSDGNTDQAIASDNHHRVLRMEEGRSHKGEMRSKIVETLDCGADRFNGFVAESCVSSTKSLKKTDLPGDNPD